MPEKDEEQDQGSEQEDFTEEGEEGSDEGGRKFSQEDVDRISSRARVKARRQAIRDLAETLGVEDIDDLKALVAKARQSSESKDHGGKKEDAAENEALKEIRADLDSFKSQTKEQIAGLKLTSQVEKALIKAGMSVAQAEKARRLVDIESDATAEEIEEAIEDLEKEMPQLFRGAEQSETDEEETPKFKPRGFNPGGGPRKRGKPLDAAAQARTILHDRHPQTKTNS